MASFERNRDATAAEIIAFPGYVKENYVKLHPPYSGFWLAVSAAMSNTLIAELFSFGPEEMGTVPGDFSRGTPRASWTCSECGSHIEVENFEECRLLIDPDDVRHRQIEWPDVMATHIFSERMVKELAAAALTGFQAHPMQWEFYRNPLAAGEPTERIPFPLYFRIEVTGTVDVDLYEIDNDEGSICTTCGSRRVGFSKSYPFAAKRLVPVPGTWDGCDFCNWRNLAFGSSLCSRRVIDLAAKHGWTNALFGYPAPGVAVRSPVPADWLSIAIPKIRERHRDLF